MSTSTEEVKYKANDFKSEAEPRWCPGCEDYAILKAVQTAMAKIGRPKNEHAVVSGIGCSSRFPYYMSTYGFHTIHGRPLPVATGLKVSNPELSVWVVTGDGDGISIGGNHLIHALRRNCDLNILLFNNRIYGLTKGQYSPTSTKGMANKTAPYGTIEDPVDPVGLAVESGATFIAQTSASYVKELVDVLVEAYNHKGTSFVHIYQNCYIYNNGAFDGFTDREIRDDNNIKVEHGKPLVFGKELNKGLTMGYGKFDIVEFEAGNVPDSVLVYDETDPILVRMISDMKFPEHPVPMGIIKRVQAPTFEESVHSQIQTAKEKFKPDLKKLIGAGETWEVK